ncbi:squalene--hopene cyclase [Planctomycetia bacterium]|nr:squalene--hopene cyclase [Planctomycetia bacterium]
MPDITPNRIRQAYETAKAALLAEMVSVPIAADDPVQKLLDAPVTEMWHWVGELSTSALSTATAVMALEQMRRQYVSAGRDVPEIWTRLIRGGIEWLVTHQNADGGWGDTIKSISNISTSMLCHAVLHATAPANGGRQSSGPTELLDPPIGGLTSPVRLDAVGSASAYIDRAGGVKAVIARYGKDRTFSVPILTHCALAGLVNWDEVISLPFELACIPAKFYAAVRLPVVSYALPALIAIGQVRFHFRPSWNPLRRWLQRWAKPASLQVLERIQPPNGGFLEATPLTSFVTMSLAAMGLIDHPVTRRGIEFIVSSARWGEGNRACSWPIDTNLATWVTTLSINALGDDVPLDACPGLRAWLLRQQYRVVHPYTNAAPGGWAWTDLPGGVPDGDDTPGAMLALMTLSDGDAGSRLTEPWVANQLDLLLSDDQHIGETLIVSHRWLFELQNSDGGWPTFCRGWGTLPFDRSSPDITAHAIRASSLILNRWRERLAPWATNLGTRYILDDAYGEGFQHIERGLKFLKRKQRPDGSWLPLWFGNQHAPNDENPTYGTAKVLAAFQALGRMSDESAVRGVRWLVENQNPDGGWGAGPGTPSSVEETALAFEALLAVESKSNESELPTPHFPLATSVQAGLSWLIPRVEDGRFREPSPIGFYFAKLWYFEALYPLIFTVAALRKAAAVCENEQ